MPGLRTALAPVQVLAVPLLRHWVAEHEREQQRTELLEDDIGLEPNRPRLSQTRREKSDYEGHADGQFPALYQFTPL